MMQKTTMKMTREEWESLRYPMELQRLSEEEGGGWMAWIPLLGKGLFTVDAETAEDAVRDLEALRRSLYDTVMNSGRPVPLPSDVTDATSASGRWLMRTSRRLHAELKAAAASEGVSFNSYCESALERGHTIRSLEAALERLTDEAHAVIQAAWRQAAEDARLPWNVVGSGAASVRRTNLEVHAA
jgi:hypothetical protein